MRHLGLLVLLASAAFAARSVTAADTPVAAAIATLKGVARDPAKLAAFCEMSHLMSADPDDLPKDDDVYKRIDADMRTLGPAFQDAWNIGAELEPETPDQKIYEAAMGELEARCGE